MQSPGSRRFFISTLRLTIRCRLLTSWPGGTRIHSELGWSSADQILVRGRSLPDEILGHMSLGTFAFFELTGREPDADEAALFDAVVITLVEHGLTPSALAARLTYLGAPESMQGAVAAGLAGLGTVFAGTTEGAAQMLTEALETRPGGTTLEEVARFTVVARSGQIIPGSATRSTSRSIRAPCGSSSSPGSTAAPATTSS